MPIRRGGARKPLRRQANLGGPERCQVRRHQAFAALAAANAAGLSCAPALLRCPMVPGVRPSLGRARGPAGRAATFSQPAGGPKIAGILLLPTHEQCRRGATFEHGHANAIDVSGFVLADGRTVQVKTGWRGAFAERTFRSDASRQLQSVQHRARSQLRCQPPRPLPPRPGS